MKLYSALAFCGVASALSPRYNRPGPNYGDGNGGWGGDGRAHILTDISQISRSWGQVSTYADNPDDYFGVKAVGLPDGCQIEQVHSLQRHAQRFPTSGAADGGNDLRFGQKITNFTSANPQGLFAGPLAFLNNFKYILSNSGYLTGNGATTNFQAGVTFWNRYGRTLYNASAGQVAYNATLANGTARRKPVLRTTNQSRMWNAQISWAAGFFGSLFEVVPNPQFTDVTSDFDVVIIPEKNFENNTMAAYFACNNTNVESIGYIGDENIWHYIPKYLGPATERLQRFAPEGFTFTVNDTYAFQSICAYENSYIGMSDFCYFFTADEWAGFENTLDMEYFYDYSYGNPTGRAAGIGYVQELLARLTDQYITVSNSSVNSTLDDNSTTFPLNEPFYADFTHDDIIISALTAMSVDYFKDPPTLTQFPPNPNRRFILSHLTPFGGRLITEVIGCADANPAPFPFHRTPYTPEQYGYDAGNAPKKFIRMRLNNGIVPLDTIRGGGCAGRIDGLCGLEDFLGSQRDADTLANYDFACFGNYTIDNKANPGKDYDGTIFEGHV